MPFVTWLANVMSPNLYISTMKKQKFILSMLFLAGSAAAAMAQTQAPVAPVAEKIPYEIKGSQGPRQDPYYWMKERENPKVMEHLKAENAYLQAIMEPTKALQEQIFNELVGRIEEDESSVPYKLGGYYYYSRYEKGGEYAIYCRKKGELTAAEEIIVNGNDLAAGNEYLSFYIEMSHDHKMAAVIMDVAGRNFYTIKIKDLSTGEWLKDEIKDTRNGCIWTTDNKSLVYGVPDKETLRVYQIKKHVIGDKAKNDVVLLQEDDQTLDLYAYESRSKEYIFAFASRTDAGIIKYTKANQPDVFTTIEPMSTDHYYTVDHIKGDEFVVRTNYQAKNYRLCKTKIAAPAKENWTDIIPARDNVFLETVEFFKDYFIAQESTNGLTTLRVIAPRGQNDYIKFDEPAYYATLGYNPDPNTNDIRFVYSSLITPYSTYEYNVTTKAKKVLKQDIIPSGYDKSQYVTERIMVTARDGKKVPMTIAYKKDTFKKDGSAPGYIYGYGAYGYSNEDYFDSNILSLMDRGFVYANTHIRGGQEMGGSWYDEGKMMNKKNSFYDFIDCSKYLIQEGYVGKQKLFANGGSAGGLLMGAVSNMAPELYLGIIADVPFVDVITTMEDETIPLTTFEWLEWGNPKNKAEYDYMMSYSPYDNVEAKNYPNMLVTTGFNDSQVQYFEPAKWVAKLRATKTDNNLLLFKINMDAGHGGQSGRYESLNETAFMYTFMLHCLGVTK